MVASQKIAPSTTPGQLALRPKHLILLDLARHDADDPGIECRRLSRLDFDVARFPVQAEIRADDLHPGDPGIAFLPLPP